MSPPIHFCPAAENIALATEPIAKLLGDKFKVLTYTIKFNEDSGSDFALGFSKASPVDCYEYEDPQEVVTFLELDPDESKSLHPPYVAGTHMYISLWRDPKNISHVYIAIKIGDYRSGTYAFTCNEYQDYLAIQCKPALIIGGFINVMTTEEYLEQRDEQDQKHLCLLCSENPAVVYYKVCGHVAFCSACATKACNSDMNCPICIGDGGFDPKVDRIGVKSFYCVNCVGKRCADLCQLNLPCKCLLSCDSNQVSEKCEYCETIVEDTKKVYRP